MSKSIILHSDGTWEEDSPTSPPLPSGRLSEHFLVSEMACNHCGKHGELASKELMQVLERMRAHFGGNPITITSGVRCDFHNANVGGASKSRHKTKYADAADIVISGISPSRVADHLEATYPRQYGIGRYPSSGFTHIDTRPNGPARWTG